MTTPRSHRHTSHLCTPSLAFARTLFARVRTPPLTFSRLRSPLTFSRLRSPLQANHAEMPIMFVEAGKLAKVAKVLSKCTGLKYVVAMSATDGLSKDVSASFEAAGVSLLEFDKLLATGQAKPVPPRPPSGDDLAFIMYTSGTTGDPKGVCIKQRAISVGASYCAGMELLPTLALTLP